MKRWEETYGLSLLTGLALVALPVLYVLNEGIHLRPLDPHEHLIQNGLTYVALLAFTYLNHTRFVPRWYLNKQYRRYVLVAFFCLLGVVLIPQRIEQWVFLRPPKNPTLTGWVRQLLWKENLYPPHPMGRRPGKPPRPLSQNQPLSVKFAIILLLGSVSTLASISVQTANRLRLVETEKLQAELGNLKGQIHPHFLFNTLNSIYSLAIRQDERTADTIVKLSEFMRYMIRDAHQHRVSLQKELDYLRNYIDLQQARLRDAVTISVSVEGDALGKEIAPLILFTFIENAFKYGVNPDVPSTIQIRLAIRRNELTLHVVNRKVPISRLDDSTSVGLQNTRERLRLLYPDSHSLQIDDTQTHFTVDLTLHLS